MKKSEFYIVGVCDETFTGVDAVCAVNKVNGRDLDSVPPLYYVTFQLGEWCIYFSTWYVLRTPIFYMCYILVHSTCILLM